MDFLMFGSRDTRCKESGRVVEELPLILKEESLLFGQQCAHRVPSQNVFKWAEAKLIRGLRPHVTFQRVRLHNAPLAFSLRAARSLWAPTSPHSHLPRCMCPDRHGFLAVGTRAARAGVPPVSGRGLLTCESTGTRVLCVLSRESGALRNEHLSAVMTASFQSSCPITIGRNVPEPRNLWHALSGNLPSLCCCLTGKARGARPFHFLPFVLEPTTARTQPFCGNKCLSHRLHTHTHTHTQTHTHSQCTHTNTKSTHTQSTTHTKSTQAQSTTNTQNQHTLNQQHTKSTHAQSTTHRDKINTHTKSTTHTQPTTYTQNQHTHRNRQKILRENSVFTKALFCPDSFYRPQFKSKTKTIR